jgi:HD-GYP domain-containing protein (c-di-GMP phosphodiesterase class II)
MTIRLAEAMGINSDELIHIRRGALLHDIGKMGISDTILNKSGPLSDKEWSIMKRHPVYAKDLLAPITYLSSAIEIPYSHHEKWDGSGYPDGLKADAIPLSARIFAVVDVWDALRSDRPYRPAWSTERARQYLRDQSGTHFDPLVITKFFELGMDKWNGRFEA